MSTPDSNDPKKRTQSDIAIKTIGFCILGGFFGMALIAIQTSGLPQFFSVIGVSLLIAGASTLSGGLLGFLFGIPRTLQSDRIADNSQSGKEQQQNSDNGISYQVNTNLEQISDWLTKIFVGVGLTQIAALPGMLKKYAEFVSPGLGGGPESKTFAVAILIFYLVCGFLISYLWTRLYLKEALKQADLASVVNKMENKLSEIENQNQIDAKALNIVQSQLNSRSGVQTISVEDLASAINPSSSPIKVQIYNQVTEIRKKNWQDHNTKPAMERTIPVFRALIACDQNEHLYHGQLGYALKDQRQPDWAEAEKELSKAIELRGPWDKEGYLAYELVRAICNINLDPALKQEKPSGEDVKKLIHGDLKIAAYNDFLEDAIAKDETIQKWMKLNKIK